MKKFTFLVATILALASAELAQAGGGLSVNFGFRQRSRVAIVVVQPPPPAIYLPPQQIGYGQQSRLGFNSGYGQLNLNDGCGVQAFSAGYGGQAVILRSRVCGLGY